MKSCIFCPARNRYKKYDIQPDSTYWLYSIVSLLLRYREDFYCVLWTKWKGAISGFLEDSHHYKIRGHNKRERAWSLTVCGRLSFCSTPWEDGSQELNDATIRHTVAGDDTTIISAFAWSVREDRRKLHAVMIINSVEGPSGQFPKKCLHSHRHTNLLHAVQKPMFQTISAWATRCDT